ncbi:hypothetical protein CKM354_000949100 [Cercospora kikuchii]|uniref:Uncharacterized protein n=1 Tax=Cercospora kikuchii TaxID=84275 RepID=A0A9P3CXM9_9PEZI|nr:uncharacterized protein CKM354_000949100 [Cercospora kikuchii]GIZ46363.1 hypothetical protein CKM354_000949100 [Cercospora kikuchii]
MSDNSRPLDIPPPGVSYLEYYMNRARRVVPVVAAPPPPVLPKSLDFEERLRLERAIAKTTTLIETAQAQLDRPKLLPFELTPSEAAEEDHARAKQYTGNLGRKLQGYKIERTNRLLVDVLQTIDEYKPLAASPCPSRIPRPASVASTSSSSTSTSASTASTATTSVSSRSVSRIPRPSSAPVVSSSTPSSRRSLSEGS